ncbi:MAG: hypothetical protein ABSF10_13885 [Verrucomicrobiota bacterium]|jgi:hypothetical protein
MKNKKYKLGLSILASGLSFVGAANATDLIVNGNFALPSDGSGFSGPHCGDYSGNACTGGPGGTSTCGGAFGWQYFTQYNLSYNGYGYNYYDGPAIPASENPGSYYSACQCVGGGEWSHFSTPQDETGFLDLNMPQYAASETVMLTDAVSGSDIDAGMAQYTFSAWLASYGTSYDGNGVGNPEQPFLVLQFFSTPSGQPFAAGFLGTAAIFDRCTNTYAVTFANGTTTIPADVSADHQWIKYVATGVVPATARQATVFMTRSPNAGLHGSPDTYVDLVKLDITGVTPIAPAITTPRPTRPLPWATALLSPSWPPALRPLTSGGRVGRIFWTAPARRWS